MTPPMLWLPYTTDAGPRTISTRDTSFGDSLERLAVPARRPLTSTSSALSANIGFAQGPDDDDLARD
jgi:hypothetical protein